MGCCSGHNSKPELQFNNYDLYETDPTTSKKNYSKFSTELTDKNFSQNSEQYVPKKLSLDSRNVQRYQTGSHSQSINSRSSPYNGVGYKEIKLSLEKSKNEEIIISPPFNQQPQQNHYYPEPRNISFYGHPTPNISFGPLTTINEQDSQIGETMRNSQASRNELSSINIGKSSMQID